MKLRDLPKQAFPFNWLLAREEGGDAEAKELLDQEVTGKLVYSGGMLISVSKTNNWDLVAEIHRSRKFLRIDNSRQWSKAQQSPESVICAPSDRFRLPDWNEREDQSLIF